MYLGFWRLDARKPPPLLEVSEKYAPEVSKSGHSKPVKAWVEEHKDKIELFYLPS